MSEPDITYIVSAFNRPVMLPVCLWSIKGQSHQDFECIVADNADHEPTAKAHEQAVKQLNDPRFEYVRTHGKTEVSDPYWAAEYIMRTYECGRWLCFPCDDTYLVPQFAQRMLLEAHRRNADFVYCHKILVGPEASGGWEAGYCVWGIQMHRTPKTSFIVKRDAFKAFEGKLARAGYCNADYFVSSQMQMAGFKIAVVEDGPMVVHN